MPEKEKKDKKLIDLIAGDKKRREDATPGDQVNEPDYKETSVEEIVRRMEKKYKDRGILEEDGIKVTRGEKLKEMVVGVKPIHLDRRTPEDLVHKQNYFLRFVGGIYSVFSFLTKITDRIGMWNSNQALPIELNKAHMDYSVRQYVSIAVIFSLIMTGFFFLVYLLLSLTLLGFVIDEMYFPIPPDTLEIADILILFIIKSMLSAILAGFSGFFMLFMALKYPIIAARKRGIEIDRELPFALRQMATEIRAGIGIHGSLRSLVKSDYGTLSDEFARVLRDIEKGKSTEDALDEMVMRSPSESLATAGVHMIRAIRTGGNLSDIISQIADEVSFKLRMKMKSFVASLNLVGLMYMMIGVIAPVLVAVLASVFTAVPMLGLAGILSPESMFVFYFVIIPGILGTALYFIKLFQPM
ncbi:type II secretion system F family protein [archaeon]|nr:type II secretion system F family protein [archaeon]